MLRQRLQEVLLTRRLSYTAVLVLAAAAPSALSITVSMSIEKRAVLT